MPWVALCLAHALHQDRKTSSMILSAEIPTSNASKYLQQLCKHWSHKFATEFTATEGSIVFLMGPIRMTADNDALTVTIEPDADADADVERFQQVVANHLDRFAFREAPLKFDWREVDPVAHT
jgi:hypothetical protein